ncbi:MULTISPECIES: hypothetical protein [Alteromonas]|uniref:Uncharacterized protein n=1 Tax=Alteromonas stellipolaris TaxID=233316 RepID=A0AAW7Z6K6_9ALTE|nr:MULTISPECIES: hypothetical protein [Alteromonas]AMJ90595.1 hypothetical protein AV940_08975 [Alteromonas sp. Mac2]AMJ86735.1 hypothetical protein AV939_09195 [Alteromonas sp. Mac1]AMJ94480.1 hypothetical protein AVL56_09325 [Alteromonas stellipolaris]ANB23135.1 hypothetical protein A6K25_18865 [Alteromonas stellipolaris]ANB26542.1 hypothetical protein A6F57_15910 [Alteromonas stellipolaris]
MTALLVILITLAGAFTTYRLAKLPKFNVIRASSLLTILFYFSVLLIENVLMSESRSSETAEFWATVFFGGSFVGMSAPHRFSYYLLTISSLCFAIIFMVLLPLLEGIGGALGCSAFISVAISHSFRMAVTKLKGA